ncbi:MAG: CaiB/BaiF CoA-transferase family protein [Sphingobacteriaceae bacterium]|nr:CaiB/BaiF CoA-transferase family protein [Sphingobacteriaceae bacterium]
MSGALQHIKVIELAAVLAGPSVGQFLAELGAEVLKIEPPSGDVTRSWRLANEQPVAGRSAYFCAANWGKRSLFMDLREPEQQQELLRLLADADILLMSYKPGDAAKFGLAPEELLKRFPGLIIGEISGYGEADPRVGYDAIIQAEAGFTYLNGNNQEDFHKMPVALVDVLAAHQLKQGILLALLQRAQTGLGQRVQVALLDAAISALANQATNYLVGGIIPQPLGSEHPNIVPYGSIYTCADGVKVVLAVGTDKQFAALCSMLELPYESAWDTNAGRVQSREAVNYALQQAICKAQSLPFMQQCEQLHIPCGRVNQMDEVMQIAEKRGLVVARDGVFGLRNAVFAAPPQDLLAPPSFKL